jgi:serine/threonine protein kinase
MVSLENIEFLSSKNFKSFVKNIIDNDTVIPKNVMDRFMQGSFDAAGKKGKVIIENGIAYKMNPTIGYNSLKNNKVYLSPYYLQILINYIIEYIFTYQLPDISNSFVKALGSKVISKKGYSSFEAANRGDLSSYLNTIEDPYDMDSILVQSIYDISDILYNLEQYNFIHNDLKSDNVLVHEDDEGFLSYKINDFDNSYIEFNGLELGVNRPIFHKVISNPSIINIDKEYFFINPFSDLPTNLLSGAYFRENREKIVSLDTYTFILSLVFHKNVIKNVNSLPKFNKLVDYIFQRSDLEKIKDMMYNDSIITITQIIGFIINNKIGILYDPDAKIKKFYSIYL